MSGSLAPARCFSPALRKDIPNRPIARPFTRGEDNEVTRSVSEVMRPAARSSLTLRLTVGNPIPSGRLTRSCQTGSTLPPQRRPSSTRFFNATPQGCVDKFPATPRGLTALSAKACDERFGRKFHITHCGGVAKIASPPPRKQQRSALFPARGLRPCSVSVSVGCQRTEAARACEPLTHESLYQRTLWGGPIAIDFLRFFGKRRSGGG